MPTETWTRNSVSFTFPKLGDNLVRFIKSTFGSLVVSDVKVEGNMVVYNVATKNEKVVKQMIGVYVRGYIEGKISK